MNNPLRILQTLDSYLAQPAEITLFECAAVAFGSKDAPAKFAATYDVDARIPDVPESGCFFKILSLKFWR